MEEDLRALVKICVEAGLHIGLNAEHVNMFCSKHGLDHERFSYAFAKHVALEFANGELSFSDGELAMKDLAAFIGPDTSTFVSEIDAAFDAGVFHRQDDPVGTIPWQKYTLPHIMRVLISEGLVPCT